MCIGGEIVEEAFGREYIASAGRRNYSFLLLLLMVLLSFTDLPLLYDYYSIVRVDSDGRRIILPTTSPPSLFLTSFGFR